MTNRKNLTGREWAFAAVVVVAGIWLGVAFAGRTTERPPPTQPAPTAVHASASDIAREGTPDARAVWAKFDALIPAAQTKEALGNHLVMANGADPSIPLRRYNGGQFRKRMATKLGNGAFVEGEDLDILVPSQAANECIAWGVANLDQETKDALLTMQFSLIRCYGQNSTDGKRTIAREWQIP